MKQDWLTNSLQEAARHYGFNIDRLEKISGGYENEMFGHDDSERRFVIRVTPPDHRSENEVRAEIDWLQYLYEHGAPVERLIPTQDGEPVLVVETEHTKTPVVCFEWASGRLTSKDDFTSELFHTWGKAVGLMHALTKDYKPPSKPIRRHQWHEDVYLSRDLIPPNQDKVLERFDNLIGYFKSLPKDKDSFGLIHLDVHHMNFFLDGNRITILDFDDCLYDYFITDIANALGFIIWDKPEDLTNREFADLFLKHFMNGYETENHLDDFWMSQLPRSLKIFEFIHYNAFSMDYNLSGEGSFDALDDRMKIILNRYRNSIENDLSYIENTFCPYR